MKKRTKKQQPDGAVIAQPNFRPISVRHSDGTIHTHYLSEYGERAVDAHTAAGAALNDAIAAVVPGYVTPIKPEQLEQAPACIIDLGVAWPCTIPDIHKAWKRAARAHHPDRQGGDAAKFIVARRAYEEACAIFGTREVSE